MADERLNPYAPPIATEREPEPVAAEVEGPKGIGGWLLLSFVGVLFVGAICFIALVRGLMILDDLLAMFEHVWFPWKLITSMLLASAVFGLAVLAVAWMVRHDRRLPNLMVAFYVLQAIMWLVAISINNSDGTYWFWPVRCMGWIFYYRHSKRVENTFVK